ncbi:MAG: hypothetical protein JWR90_2156 [Marmoricola sp.]|jgi:uncharacterized protein with FMN-binding domain|nr:hypothetical protein [Marmoricola sp.]
MRRISLWVLSTLSVLVLLFGYHTSTSGPQATGSQTSIYSSGSGSSGSGSSGSGSGSSGSSDSGASGSGSTGSSGTTPPASGSTSSGSKTVTGTVAQTRWGPVQVQLKVSNGKVTNVSVVQYPDGNGRDQEINSQALPILTEETINAQSAQIDMVSGATVTSDGYLESLQSALDQAGL